MKTILNNKQTVKSNNLTVTSSQNKLSSISDCLQNLNKKSGIDFEDVLAKFRKHEIEVVDKFCESYILENFEKEGFNNKEVMDTVQELRAFLFVTKRNRNNFMN